MIKFINSKLQQIVKFFSFPPITMKNMNESSRRRTRKAYVQEPVLENDCFYPHIPLSANLLQDSSDEQEGAVHDGSLKGDYANIALLMFLYVLQGIPLGLAGSIPMLLSSRKVSYKEQALFSFVYWPFSMKLVWAPLVDSIYSSCFGRRKTWLVPTQYLIGIFMFTLSGHVTDVLGDSDSTAEVNILLLTCIFFMLNFLAATQDIAVDGWALTMLSRKNVGWASTCNSVGQTTGYFLGNVVFLALESAEFCNKYLRFEPQPVGILTLAGFLYFWGIVFFVTTTLVWILKKESDDLDMDPDQGIVNTYKTLYKVMKLPAVLSYCGILLTCKIGFAAADALTGLKLIEAGVRKETLALFAVPMVPLQIVLALVISKYTAGPRPLAVFLKAMPYRVLLGIIYALGVNWAYKVQVVPGEFPWYFYAVILCIYAIHQVFVYSMFVATMAFAAKISDPAIGGTYMTLLNTLSNLGGNWPSTLALWLVDSLTWKRCSSSGDSCNSPPDVQACKAAGGSCVTSIDGYYIESAFCVVVGLLWIKWKANKLRHLDTLGLSEWTCR
ncbi:acetyl-coenzyme A transporter 1-like [Gigantopelta aegis]|uniref:acetyl-coenzyme A transporter 1-like n=1 Tax=Gigantopelta aegis TaxID=1735272 RepID=UPI001B88B6BC|nr:acetyl-coenzyme A transporter 1-like [Gigantopelta aegis]